jgi:hypothetical protein|uniref:SprT-like domain-containing protein Spartan/DNA Complex repair, protease, DNA BINDING n=1 Tax=Siphoviridae sp. ctvxh7 TaxID=2827283 RepID=A0A8S5RAA3_9CAUD|nr:MAG TPA: SprT-like domain-containing protein Spartan/DNA Complex repair, protease, DNA BINDING [Siphoviridae sp. ctvxh7]
MTATNEELALLEKWKRKLCLQEWRIKLLTHLHPEEMTMSDAAGCTEWSESIKTARIEIINPACYGDRIVPFNFEKTLVHELLHLKFSFWCQNEDDVGDRVMHQMIDDLARALTEGDSQEFDFTPVVHGRWIRPHWKNSNYCCDCSECGGEAMHRDYQWDKNGIYPICPNCGAKMDGRGQ